MTQQTADNEPVPSRWQIIRSLLIFQYKLLIDAGKDFLLSPLSLAAALVDIFRPGPPSRMLFPALMGLGRKAETAINLFGQHPDKGRWIVDRVVESVETRFRDRYDPSDGTREGADLSRGGHGRGKGKEK